MTPLPPFANEPVLELRRAPVRARLADALAAVDARGPVDAPVLDRAATRAPATRSSPPTRARPTASSAARPRRRRPARSTRRSRSRAPGASRPRSAPPCSCAPPGCCASAGWSSPRSQVRECAKPWPEADGDVCEAIDFLEYYARGALELEAGAPLLQVPGERNTLQYVARGVVAVISPWNFPMAIPCGMVAAGLATGNAVLLKPAEQAPGCAAELVRALREAGVPPEALALLPGEGDVGAALVRDPRVHTIAFTGLLRRRARDRADGRRGRAGPAPPQAGDRRDGRQELRDRRRRRRPRRGRPRAREVGLRLRGPEVLGGGAGARARGDPRRARRAARRRGRGARGRAGRAARHRRAGGDRARRAGAGRPLPRRGGAVGPDRGASRATCPTRAGSRRRRWPSTCRAGSAVLEEEIFGPLLAVERVRDVEEACDRVDASSFGLTGGLFARNPDTVDYVVDRTPVGNLYVNRAITGAMVARQPFGGNRLSGTGTKAGGPGLPAAVRRAARGDGEHHAPRARRLSRAQPPFAAGHVGAARLAAQGGRRGQRRRRGHARQDRERQLRPPEVDGHARRAVVDGVEAPARPVAAGRLRPSRGCASRRGRRARRGRSGRVAVTVSPARDRLERASAARGRCGARRAASRSGRRSPRRRAGSRSA